MSNPEKVFADGFIFKRNPKAPEFVVGRVSVKVDDAIAFLKQNERNGWVNMDIKQARSGNYYIELDTFVPQGSGQGRSQDDDMADANNTNGAEVINDDLPF